MTPLRARLLGVTGLGLVTLLVVIQLVGVPVGIHTYDDGCYLDFVDDAELVIADGDMHLQAPGQTHDGQMVSWPVGFSARGTLLGPVTIFDASGRAVATSGTPVRLPGGTGLDGRYWACAPST